MKKLDKTGVHIHMSPEEIADWASVLKKDYETYLKKYGVMLPKE